MFILTGHFLLSSTNWEHWNREQCAPAIFGTQTLQTSSTCSLDESSSLKLLISAYRHPNLPGAKLVHLYFDHAMGWSSEVIQAFPQRHHNVLLWDAVRVKINNGWVNVWFTLVALYSPSLITTFYLVGIHRSGVFQLCLDVLLIFDSTPLILGLNKIKFFFYEQICYVRLSEVARKLI